MQNPGIPKPPAVHLFYDEKITSNGIIFQICMGLEEQGIPCQTTLQNTGESALQLGQRAARSSALRVGLGVSALGETVLTHAQLPIDQALRSCPPESSLRKLRNIGANAGQLVKVIPFSEAT
ncbi:glycerol dehydratase reactivase beta/small subunit family protein [Rahnella inusitata]|uniref:glycerol dehydratase reactivase beta/small subunit family protein n=1 Tax=Rahnella inusitata TaxID=58169 RepID=UPI0039BE290A